jgi:hypothetical protein
MFSVKAPRSEKITASIRAAKLAWWRAMSAAGATITFVASETVEGFAQDAIALHPELFFPPSEVKRRDPPLK